MSSPRGACGGAGGTAPSGPSGGTMEQRPPSTVSVAVLGASARAASGSTGGGKTLGTAGGLLAAEDGGVARRGTNRPTSGRGGAGSSLPAHCRSDSAVSSSANRAAQERARPERADRDRIEKRGK
jgi:hypothetical protein